MKYRLLISIVTACFVGYSQMIPSLPEYNIMYMSYNNKVVINKGCNDSIQVIGNGETLVSTQFRVKGVVYSGFLAKPSSPKTYNIVVKGFKKGKLVSSDTTSYKIKPFPFPVILDYTISKSAGGQINVGMIGTPIDITYNVASVSCGNFNGEGNFIPSHALSSNAIGDNVGVSVNAINLETGENTVIRGSLKVVE